MNDPLCLKLNILFLVYYILFDPVRYLVTMDIEMVFNFRYTGIEFRMEVCLLPEGSTVPGSYHWFTTRWIKAHYGLIIRRRSLKGYTCSSK